MFRKSLHVRTVISHFVEIGEVLKIETWHNGRLLLLEAIVSDVKGRSGQEKYLVKTFKVRINERIKYKLKEEWRDKF